MRIFNYNFFLLLLFGILACCQLKSQTQIFIANTSSGTPCNDPPCGPTPIDSLSDIYNDPTHQHSDNNYISPCYFDNSLSGNARVVVSFELNSPILPSYNQSPTNFLYAIQLFAHDINGTSLPILSISDISPASGSSTAMTHQIGNWYNMIHWENQDSTWRGNVVIQVDNSNNNLASGFLSVDFQLGYMSLPASINNFSLIGNQETIMAGTRCQLDHNSSTLRKAQTLTQLKFAISPNPAHNYFNIISNSRGIYEEIPMAVRIYDIKGRELYYKIIEPAFFDGKLSFRVEEVNHLKKGVYFVETNSNSQREFLKLVIH